jgi:copper chaperone CopZ
MHESVIIKVNGMIGGEGENAINSKLSALNGIKSAQASEGNKEVKVNFDTDFISLGDIIQELQDAGFEVVEE